jgi:hypothetical protein
MGIKIKAVRNKGFRDFSFVCRELAAMTGNDMATVIDSEVTAILQDTVAKTKVAPLNKIINDHSKQEWMTYEIPYQGSVAGREGYFSAKANARRSSSKVSPRLKFRHDWRMPNWLWAEIRARRTALVTSYPSIRASNPRKTNARWPSELTATPRPTTILFPARTTPN